ncbi:transcription factor kayak-like [Drosophila navojoa]|uniref:transcription factor kayak-like n=1 Tax=Drosophila navojoa TaxID=7232 RepID=UPI0011BD8431|nr:transcription factor kayak-like [Drosophila navojoa]
MHLMRGLLVVACLAAVALQASAKPQQERRGEHYQLYRRQRHDYDLPAEGRLNPTKLAAVLSAALGQSNNGSNGNGNGSELPTSTTTTISTSPTTTTGSSTTTTTPTLELIIMRFVALALLLLSAAVLASAAVGLREDDEEVVGQRYRLYKRNADRNVEARSLAQLLAWKGGSSGGGSGTGGCAPDTLTTTEIIPSPSTITGSSTETTSPITSSARGSSRPGQALTLQEYEMRRQAEENKELRKRIEVLRRQNMKNIRRAQRARRQQRRRNKNQRRRSSIRNRNIRRRLQNRHRNARRRLRRNRRRN